MPSNIATHPGRPLRAIVGPAAMFALALVVAPLGCGGVGAGGSAPLADTPTSGPHGGPMVPLPANAGFAEINIEYEGNRAVVAAYFVDADNRPLATLPADIVVKLQMPDGETVETVNLKPAPVTDKLRNVNDTGKARFASAPGRYDVDRLVGEISGTHAGQPFTESFQRSQ